MTQNAIPLLFPIRTLAERTGVAATTLRAWERRYGLLSPQRTPKGHRLYSENDVQLVMDVLELLKQGHAISEVAKRVKESDVIEFPRRESENAESDAQEEKYREDQWKVYVSHVLDAVEAFSQTRLDAAYNEASSLYPIDLVSKNLIEPALKQLGDRWSVRETGIAEEHFFLAWLRNKLGARLHHEASNSNGSTIVVACLPGHRHEIGALLFSLAALGRGYQVIYLGADMPLEPLDAVVRRCGAKGVVLSGAKDGAPEELFRRVSELNDALPCPLFVGGEISVTHGESLVEAGVMPVGEQFSLALHLLTSRVPVYESR